MLKLKFTKSDIISLLYIPFTVVYLEFLLRIKCGIDLDIFLFPLLLLSLAFGLIFGAIALLFNNSKVRKGITLGLLFLLCLYFCVEAFIRGNYQTFMTLDSIVKGTGGVLTDFSDELIKAITGGFFYIIAMFIPFIAFTVMVIKKFEHDISAEIKNRVLIGIAGLSLVLNLSGAAVIFTNEGMLDIYRNAYNFNNAVSSFGLLTGTRLDLQYSIFGNSHADEFIIEEPEIIPDDTIVITPIDPETPENPDEPVEPEIEYGYNVTDIDFESIMANTSNNALLNVHKYVSSLSGTKQNEYTGIFEGKNLILIAAESFALEVIDPVLTPTLYRLYDKGFTFTEYYQPVWGGSTSTGEYSIFTGLIPTAGVSSIRKIVEGNTDFTIGNMLRDEGYFSAAYHNGSYTYYSRNLTHEKLGYDSFTAFGNGLEKKGVDPNYWPASDLELFQFTISDYIDKQPFSVYYMTVSGHGFYGNFNHAIARKNREAVEGLDYSTTVQCYIAANLELEYALAHLIGDLEAAGIADDTVIALTTDHYPYALEKGEAWGNTEDYLSELYGFTPQNSAEREHNALLIWSGCLENEYEELAITVDEPTYSLDILPTLCNLFGLPYDSRLLVGRDVFSDSVAIAIWPDYNWKTELGYYDFTRKKFTPDIEGNIPSDEYIEYINNIVKNKIAYSKAVINYDYFGIVFEEN